MRIQWAAVCVVLFVLFSPDEVMAQVYAENTLQACGDGADNDGDGYVDCYDQDCGIFCQQPQPQAQAVYQQTTVLQPGGTGWSLAGGILGFTMASISMGLAIGSELTSDELIPALPLGASSFVLTAVFVPVVAGSANSARRRAGVRGCIGCAIPAWITYGLSMSGWIVLIAYNAAAEEEPPTAVIGVTGLLGATSLCLMAGNALAARRQALRQRTQSPVAPRERRIAWAPFVVPINPDDGVRGTLFGVSLIH